MAIPREFSRDRHLGADEALGPGAVAPGFRSASPFAVGGLSAQGPRYATCWVALTEAVPDNGCLFVIPKR